MDNSTVWDFYAGCALMGIVGNNNAGTNTERDKAWYAARCADELMKERRKREGSVPNPPGDPDDELGF